MTEKRMRKEHRYPHLVNMSLWIVNPLELFSD